MTTAIARRGIVIQRDVGRHEHRLFGRRAARWQRKHVLHVTDEVGVLLSLLADDDDPELSDL